MNPIYKLIEKLYISIPGNMVYFDHMTGLKNRNYYNMVIKEKYISVACDIVYVDINDLKQTNDTKGHTFGSKLICEVANIISTTKADEVCRIGGDEFILIYKHGIDVEDRDWLDNHKDIMSYGVYEKEKYEDISSGTRKADELMYKMKNNFHKVENKG